MLLMLLILGAMHTFVNDKNRKKPTSSSNAIAYELGVTKDVQQYT